MLPPSASALVGRAPPGPMLPGVGHPALRSLRSRLRLPLLHCGLSTPLWPRAATRPQDPRSIPRQDVYAVRKLDPTKQRTKNSTTARSRDVFAVTFDQAVAAEHEGVAGCSSRWSGGQCVRDGHPVVGQSPGASRRCRARRQVASERLFVGLAVRLACVGHAEVVSAPVAGCCRHPRGPRRNRGEAPEAASQHADRHSRTTAPGRCFRLARVPWVLCEDLWLLLLRVGARHCGVIT